MICPICQAEVDQNRSFCQYCGAKLNAEDDIISAGEHSELVQPKKEKEMVFNIVFAIMMLWNGANSAFGALSIIPALFLNSSSLPVVAQIISTVVTLLISAFGIVTGIMLLKKKKLGYILSNVANVIYCIGSFVSIGLGIGMIYIGATDPSEWSGFGYLFGVVFLIVAIPTLIFHIISFVYYRKNRHKFVN